MILKGNQRAGGADLATHLLNAFENERVEVMEVRGTVARDLLGAFSEYEAAACGTRCKQPLYSLSINPSAPITREQYSAAIDKIEERLGLSGQPRTIVFHVKNGREHCHVVWSRIDTRMLRAIPMSHDHMKLRALAREIATEYGLELPPGLKADRGSERFNKPPNMTLAEKSQAEETGITPRHRRADITDAWRVSDNAGAFTAALGARGYTLARGDRRSFVVVDRFGHVHSLSRCIEGAKAEDIHAKLYPLTADRLPDVADVRAAFAARECLKQAQLELKAALARLEGERKQMRDALARKQRQRRQKIDCEKQSILLRHAAERMMLHAGQKSEADALVRQRTTTDAKRLSAFLQHIPGYASAVGYFRRRQDESMAARHVQQRTELQRRQANGLIDTTRKSRALDKLEAREKRSLEKHLMRIARQHSRVARTAARQAAITQNAQDIANRVRLEDLGKAGRKARKRGQRTRDLIPRGDLRY